MHRGFLCVNREFGSVELRRNNVGRYIKYPKYDALRNNRCVKQFSKAIFNYILRNTNLHKSPRLIYETV